MGTPREISERIEAQAGVPGLAQMLAGLPASDLQSLLLEVYRGRAVKLREADIMARTAQPLAMPSTVDARLLARFDRAAFETAAEFEAIELAPSGPLGAAHILGGIDQNNVLSTIRNVEVWGDSTPGLAIECARRRRLLGQRTAAVPIRLCASQRVVRLQPFDVPGFSPHFRLFALVTAGRDSGSNGFEMRHLAEHLRFYLRLFQTLTVEGFHMTAPLVEISDMAVTAKLLEQAGVSREEVRLEIRAHRPGGTEAFLAERGIRLEGEPGDRLTQVEREVFEPLRPEFPDAHFRFDLARLEGMGYYPGLCLRIAPAAADGERHAIVDGGFTDWTARLLGDRKERLLTSGIGSEFTCKRYLDKSS